MAVGASLANSWFRVVYLVWGVLRVEDLGKDVALGILSVSIAKEAITFSFSRMFSVPVCFVWNPEVLLAPGGTNIFQL